MDNGDIAAELGQQLHQLQIVLQVYNEVSSSLNIDDVELIALDAAQRLSHATGGFIALVEEERAWISKMIGPYPQSAQTMWLDPNRGVVGQIITSHQAAIFFDITATQNELPTLPGTQARMIIPLMSRYRCIGLVNLETDKPERFTEEVFRLLQILEQYISVALDNAGLYHQVNSQLAELQRLYAQISRLEQLKTDMIRVAAHDLRNPLSVIYTYLSLLGGRSPVVGPKQQEYFDGIKTAATRMNEILQDILSLERIEKMADLTAADTFNLAPLAERAVTEYQQQAADKALQLRIGIDGSAEPIVRGDPSQLYEALVNLISNAIKYTPANGVITISLQVAPQQVIFKVKDTGYGIPAELQERLFQPFYRAKTTETLTIDGTGLGLHLVKNIVERHGGEMIFQSVYGQGSTFGFILPS